ncbi:MAG: sensor histidine kinase [Methylovirgula sp.]
MSLGIVWIAAIVGFYRDHREDMRKPPSEPIRLAAMVHLVEGATMAQRALLFDATANHFFHMRIIPAGVAPPPAVGTLLGKDVSAPYAAAVDGRPLQIMTRSNLPTLFNLPHRLFHFANIFEIRVGLRTGETLIMDSHRPLIINRFGIPVGFSAGLIGTVVALVALLLAQRETKPLERLAVAVDQVDLSGTQVSVPEVRRSAPEIRALVAAFNRLQGRLGSMLRSRMALVGGISHDVRTFATRLRLRIEAIPDEAERQRAMNDIDDMILLLDDALISSRAGAGELAQELIEVAPLVQDEVEDRRGAGASISCKCDEGVSHASILGDRLALRRVIANLIDNALKYGHAAHLSVGLRGADVALIVDDEGPGIPQDQCELMLEPFSRLETSRSRETGGAGLGLAVVRTLVEAQAGRIEIGAAPGGGARVMLFLPVFQPLTGNARAG